jgi:hypothetical protein
MLRTVGNTWSPRPGGGLGDVVAAQGYAAEWHLVTT